MISMMLLSITLLTALAAATSLAKTDTSTPRESASPSLYVTSNTLPITHKHVPSPLRAPGYHARHVTDYPVIGVWPLPFLNIELQGKKYPVFFDTGSSDSFVLHKDFDCIYDDYEYDTGNSTCMIGDELYPVKFPHGVIPDVSIDIPAISSPIC